jgi:hypothetical protein
MKTSARDQEETMTDGVTKEARAHDAMIRAKLVSSELRAAFGSLR